MSCSLFCLPHFPYILDEDPGQVFIFSSSTSQRLCAFVMIPFNLLLYVMQSELEEGGLKRG